MRRRRHCCANLSLLQPKHCGVASFRRSSLGLLMVSCGLLGLPAGRCSRRCLAFPILILARRELLALLGLTLRELLSLHLMLLFEL